MKARIQWLEKAKFTAESDRGHRVVMDGPPEAGGEDGGFRPMELVLAGLGGCTAFDVVSILEKARQQIQGCEVLLEAERADSIPKVFTRIHILFRVSGHQLKPAAVARAVSLSAEKYCSATLMLKDRVEITHDYEIIETDTNQTGLSPAGSQNDPR